MLLPWALAAGVLFHADWEDGLGTEEALITDGLYAYERSEGGLVEVVHGGGRHPPARAGKGMLRFEIEKTDGDFGCRGCRRIEVKTDPFVRDMPYSDEDGMSILGETFWYAWSVFNPDGQGPDDKRVMGQWPSRWQDGGYNEGHTMGLEMYDGRWHLSIQRARHPSRHRIIDLGPVATGEWTDWVFQIHWDMDQYPDDGDKGFVRVWKNSRLIDEDGDGYTDTGVNCFLVEDPDEVPFFKFGTYKREGLLWVPERFVAYYDELRIGDASATFEDMAPRGERPDPAGSGVSPE